MTLIEKQSLAEQAKAILLNNWKNGYTIPSPTLYPFQWNWDSGFIALGYLHIDPSKALAEMQTLFSGQWQNGMLPHILFIREVEGKYFPNADFWGSPDIPGTPAAFRTSGISQPPVHGSVLERFLNHIAADPTMLDGIKALYPKVLRLHDYFYTHRDPLAEGLVYINHPWESGRDNSPLWNDVFATFDIPEGKLPAYTRVDNTLVDPSERPTQDDYDRYIYLVSLGKENGYADAKIYRQSPFLVQDTLFNAVLIASERSLIRIGQQLGVPTEKLEKRLERSVATFNRKLWNSELGCYCGYDLKNDRQITYREAGGLAPLLAQIPDESRAQKIIDVIEGPSFAGPADDPGFLCASFDRQDPKFVSHKYWQGPVWININWLLIQGLRRYDEHALADRVISDTLELVSIFGPCEYFEPSRRKAAAGGKGFGSTAFSWTAALVLDLINA